MPELGRKIFLYSSVTSTNDVLKKMALQNAMEGTLVLAEEQTSGKGRMGRSWLSLAGKGLYCSILLRPAHHVKLGLLSLAVAVSIARTIHQLTRIRPALKWPNDILINSAKVSGILLEANYTGKDLNFVVAGIGVNLFHELDDFAGELAAHSSSIQLSTGKKVDPDTFLQSILLELEKRYNLLLNTEGEGRIREEWLTYCLHIDKLVHITCSGHSHAGIFRGLTSLGGALVELESGEMLQSEKVEFSLREIPSCY